MKNKKHIIRVLLLMNLCISYSQISSIVVDSISKKPLIYTNIWVKTTNIGTTTNKNGEFYLPKIESKKIIIFSSIGYEVKKIQFNAISRIVKLKPKIIELSEIKINSKKETNELSIGEFKKGKINYYISSGRKPWIFARFFSYDKEYKKTPILKSIKILTKSKVENSKFNIRLYAINEKGEPENYIYSKNIIGNAKKGKKYTEIDLRKLNILFPKNGFFIAVEWLIIEENKYKFNYTMKGSNKKHEKILFAPKFGTIASNSSKNSWIFHSGKWSRIWKNTGPLKKYLNKYNLLAIELNLTN